MRELRDCINNAMFAKQKSSWQALLGMCMPAGYSAICTAAAHWRTLWSKTGQQQRKQGDSFAQATARPTTVTPASFDTPVRAPRDGHCHDVPRTGPWAALVRVHHKALHTESTGPPHRNVFLVVTQRKLSRIRWLKKYDARPS